MELEVTSKGTRKVTRFETPLDFQVELPQLAGWTFKLNFGLEVVHFQLVTQLEVVPQLQSSFNLNCELILRGYFSTYFFFHFQSLVLRQLLSVGF